MAFHWIYKPFIYNIFFQIGHLLEKENTFYFFGGKTERNEVSKRKHWKFNVAIDIWKVPWNAVQVQLCVVLF